MSTNKIVKRTVASFYLMALMVLIVSCDTGNGMMHGNNSMGMNNLNWTQILIGIGVVCLIGFIIWVVISRRKQG
jgi:MFS-type transporter involved in bile tolerance (Atg22 family)